MMKQSQGFKHKALVLALASASPLMLPTTAHAGGFAVVYNSNDSGHGSLREALEQQQASSIFILPSVKTIEIDSTLNYASQDALRLYGTGQTIKTDENVTLLAVTEGADVKISNLSFEGRQNFYSIENRGDLDTEAGKGIFVDVRDDQEGYLSVQLRNVSVSGVANHGIHISDCSLADDCGAGSGGAGNGSPASIFLSVEHVSVFDAGNGKFDADGVRIDDRGAGDIIFRARHSSFTDVGADGVELDEGDDGSVYADIAHSDFSHNGGYCDPDLLEPYLPVPDEAEFDESEAVTIDQIPAAISGSLDDSCFEREVDLYDSGFVEEYAFGLDLDDGIDLDEAGEGSIAAYFVRSTINHNLDEGVDFDEEDGGDMLAAFIRTQASGNRDDGFKLSEEDEGDVFGDVRRSEASDNGGKGIVFEEADAGDLFVNVKRTRTFNNDDSDDTGIEAVQEDEGTGEIRLRRSDIADGLDLEGVTQI